MAKELIIKIGMDRSAASAASRAFAGEQKKLTKAILTDEQAAALASEELVKRSNQAKIKAIADAADAARQTAKQAGAAEKQAAAQAVQAARQQAAAQKQAYRDALQASRQAARDKAVAEKQAAKDATAAAKEAAKAQVQASREAAVAAKQAARDKAQAERELAALVRASSREKAAVEGQAAREASASSRAASRQMAQARKAGAREAIQEIKAEQAAEEEAAGVRQSAIKGFGSFAAQMVGLDSVKAVLGAVVENFERARESAYKAGKMVTDYRESLLELAALKGKLGDTTAATKEEIAFRAKTLQTREQAREYQTAALGVGESAIGATITREEFAKAMEKGGAFQATEGGSAEAHGVLTGLIPTLATEKTTGEQVIQKEQQLFKIMQPGGFSFTSGIQQFAKLAPLIKSGVYKDTEAAALLSAFSTSNREGAGENVQQFTRATLGGVDRKGKPRIEGSEEQGKYIKSLGVDDALIKHTPEGRLPFAIADRIGADIDRAGELAKAKGETFDPYLYLKHKGFGNQEDIGALLQYQGLKKTGALEKTFMPLAREEAKPTVAEAMAPIERAQAVDPVFARRKAELAEEAANVAVGAGPQEYAASLKQIAFARRKARGEETMGTFEEVQQQGTFSPGEVLFGHRRKTELEAQHLLEAEAARLGIKVEKPRKFGALSAEREGGPSVTYRGDEALFELAGKIKAKGGNALPGAEEVFGKAQAQLDRSKEFEGLGQPPVKAIGAPPGLPAPGPQVRVDAAAPGVPPPALGPVLAAPAQIPAAAAPIAPGANAAVPGGIPEGGVMVELLRSIDLKLTPKPAAPNPRPLVGPAKQIGRG